MTANVNIAGITALFEQYAAIHSVDVEGLRALLGRAEPHIRRLQEAQTGQRLVDTPDFDVFAITRRAHFEVTTHSAFLAHLLNPLEAHGQGNLFLKAFLSLLTERLPRWRCPPPDVRWRIERERDRIDIRLAHTAPLSCIVIENKWNAPDEEDQIFRYWQLTHQRYGNQITLIPAVYLTKTGRRPPLSLEAIHNRQFARSIVCLSYTKDIYGILDLATSKIRSQIVSGTVLQYLKTIGR